MDVVKKIMQKNKMQCPDGKRHPKSRAHNGRKTEKKGESDGNSATEQAMVWSSVAIFALSLIFLFILLGMVVNR